MTYTRFDIKKLIVTERSIFEGNVCFDNDMTIRGDLSIAGSINDIAIGTQGATTPQKLLGMWSLIYFDDSGSDLYDTSNDGSKFANFDSNVGGKNSRDFFRSLSEWNQINRQYTPGKEDRTLIYFFVQSLSNEFIATVNVDTGLITYISTTTNGARGPVYDQDNDRYLALSQISDELYEFNPSTGAPNLLNGSVGTTMTASGDGVIIGDTAFFSSGIDFGTSIQSDPMMTAVNKNTGAFISNITWSGEYIYSGTEFQDIGDENILSMALDTDQNRLQFLLGKENRRYLGYYQASSLAQLETDILGGGFDITICEQQPSERLHAISWIPVPEENGN